MANTDNVTIAGNGAMWFRQRKRVGADMGDVFSIL
jgi:hypothetical protein